MADLEAIKLKITADAQSASTGIDSLVQSLTALKKATTSFESSTALEKSLANIAKMTSGIGNALKSLDGNAEMGNSVAQGLTAITTAVNSITDESIAKIERLANTLSKIPTNSANNLAGISNDGASALVGFAQREKGLSANNGSTISTALGATGKATISVFRGMADASKKLTTAMFGNHKINLKVINDFARILKYRAARVVLSGITKSAKEGLQNLAHYSNEANAALSNLSTGTQYVSNSLGAALYPVIASVIGIFNALISVVVRALNILNMFFSILGGKGTYIKATKQAKNYASALGGAGGAAKALKQELMGFDEINALTPSGGGGGGGGGGLNYGSMFEEAPVESWLKEMMDSGDFSGLGASIADKINKALFKIPWTKVYAGAKKAAASLSSLLNGFIGEISPVLVGQTIAGIINTGATFVSDFWNQTNWDMLGTKTKDAILTAIRGIKVKTLASAITGKLRASVRFVKNLLPTSGAEWRIVTDKIAELLNNIILDIPADDIGKIIAGLITGGLKLITSLAEAGTLTNIAKAITDALKGAFAEISADDVKDALVAAIKDILGALDVLFDLKINIGEFEFSAVGTMISAGALFNVLKSAIGNLLSVSGFKSTAKAFALIAGITMMIDAAFSIAKIVKDKSMSSSEKFTEILSEIGKGLVGAGFTLLALGAGTAGAIAVSIGAAVYVGYTIISTSVANAEGSLPDDIAQQIKDAAAAASVSAEPIKVVAGALTELTGITIPESFILNHLDSMFAGTGLEDGAIDLGSLTDAMNAFIGAVQTATEQGNLDEFLSTLGLMGDAASEAEASVTEATSGVTAAAEDLQGKANDMSEALTGYQAAAEEAGTAADTLATEMGSVPDVMVIDASSLDDIAGAANSTSNALGGLSAFVAMIQRALESFGGKRLFAPVTDSANSAKDAAESLKSSIANIPESKNIKISLGNTTSINNKLTTIKKKIDGINGKTISIKVKAGLTSGAKSFLNTLKGVSSGSTAASINNLLKLSQFANGGFPRSGELFMANENGKQELVGRIGSQPAVANQDQIGDAIFRYMDAHSAQSGGGISTDELASAIVRGIKASGLGVVKLDGKTISKSINNETQRSGKPAIQF